MKKRFCALLLISTAALSLTACGSSSSASYSDDAYGSVTLCDYKNLTAEKTVLTVTEDDIDSDIDVMLYDYADFKEVDRPSANGDCITAEITGTKDGDVLFSYTGDSSYDLYLGSEDFGADFDQALTGVSAGDELAFSITYPEDYDYEDFAGATIDYTVNVMSITEEVLPELTEDFVKNTLGYDSIDALREDARARLESDNESSAEYDFRENLMQQVIDGSDFESYSQDLYDSYAAGMEESYESYMEMFGCETVEEVYNLFGMTESDIEKEVMNLVYRAIVVQAISQKEDLALTDTEYQEGLERYAEENDYDSTDALVEDYGEDSLRSWILEDKVLDFLEKYANVTVIETEAVMDTEELQMIQ